jgi:hypothetical protein
MLFWYKRSYSATHTGWSWPSLWREAAADYRSTLRVILPMVFDLTVDQPGTLAP